MLNDQWLSECICRLESRAASEAQLIAVVSQWELAALKYASWLEAEGFTIKEAVSIVDLALVKADFDLTKFPVCWA
jgi:hypothetical protein